jgi:hypothetical protein
MGAEPWDYVTEYSKDAESVLQALREKEFKAGRYNGGSSQGPQHDSIEEAMEDADSDGTCSILDIESASAVPDSSPDEPDSGVAYPLPHEKLIELFGTEKPSLQQVQNNPELYDLIGRGSCIYIIIYRANEDTPSGIYWAGYSYD